jgi:hypothetical protein
MASTRGRVPQIIFISMDSTPAGRQEHTHPARRGAGARKLGTACSGHRIRHPLLARAPLPPPPSPPLPLSFASISWVLLPNFCQNSGGRPAGEVRFADLHADSVFVGATAPRGPGGRPRAAQAGPKPARGNGRRGRRRAGRQGPPRGRASPIPASPQPTKT